MGLQNTPFMLNLGGMSARERRLLNGIARRFLLDAKEEQYDDFHERVQFAKRLVEQTEAPEPS